MIVSETMSNSYAPSNHVDDLSGVSFAWLEITQKCNLECVHCYADSSPKRDLHGLMTKNDWLKVITELADLGCKKIQFIGGEPTLHPSLKEFITHAKAQGVPYIEVFTNGVTVNDRWSEFFLMNEVRVATSFYAADKSVHEQITTKVGSYKKTCNGLSTLINAGVPVRVEVIDIEGINSASIDQTKVSLLTQGVKSIWVDKVRNIGRGSICGDQAKLGTCGNCWNRKICVTSAGTVFPCIMSRTNLIGNVLETSLEEIVSSDIVMTFRAEYKQTKMRLAICSPDGSGCSPDNSCGPDDSACGPDNCGPGDAGEDCGPDA